ncbi:MAG: acyl carrier protein [Bryobacteraceae bacterium]
MDGRLIAGQETMARIRKVFVESLHLNIRGEELPYEQMLEEAVTLDSIAVLEFITAVEKEFGITMEPKFLEVEFDFLRDLSALASYIEHRLQTHRARSGGASA